MISAGRSQYLTGITVRRYAINELAIPTVQTGRIICGALFGGIVIFWAVALFVTEGGKIPLGVSFPVDTPVVTIAALVVGVTAFAGALVLRSKALSSVSSVTSCGGEPPSPEGVSKVQSNLIVAWALLEGLALFTGFIFMLTALASLLIITLAIVVPGFALTFPRAEWYRPAQAPPGGRP